MTTLRKDLRHDALTTLLFILITILVVIEVASAIGNSIERQDSMLCRSAKVSGNSEYLAKCQCYYTTGIINCLQHTK